MVLFRWLADSPAYIRDMMYITCKHRCDVQFWDDDEPHGIAFPYGSSVPTIGLSPP